MHATVMPPASRTGQAGLDRCGLGNAGSTPSMCGEIEAGGRGSNCFLASQDQLAAADTSAASCIGEANPKTRSPRGGDRPKRLRALSCFRSVTPFWAFAAHCRAPFQTTRRHPTNQNQNPRASSVVFFRGPLCVLVHMCHCLCSALPGEDGKLHHVRRHSAYVAHRPKVRHLCASDLAAECRGSSISSRSNSIAWTPTSR